VNILGISAFYHDSAACLVQDGRIVAAAQEERFSREKHDAGFPRQAIDYCVREAGLQDASRVDLVAFYEKPFLKFERLLSTYLASAPFGWRSFVTAMPVWMKKKIWLKATLREQLGFNGPILFPEHHESHAASAFFPSPFERAAIVTIDGVGEWTTTSVGRGEESRIELLEEIRFPHSLGLLYSAFTYYLGFRVNSGEYKVMGLAPYGEPKFRDLILSELLELKADGSFRLNLRYFDFVAGLTMTNRAFDELFGGPRRQPEAELTQRHMDVARSVQLVAEEVMLAMARHAHELTGERNLCLAGGVALNCVGNGRILREGPFEKIWIQPAAGDAGGALGAALLGWHIYEDKPRSVKAGKDSQQSSFLGPAFDPAAFRETENIRAEKMADGFLLSRVARLLEEGKVIGWFDGRMEFGPRALGHRSILADPRRSDMQEKLNLKIKFRESFRPFAPAVLEEHSVECFDLDVASPYMLLVAPVQATLRSNEAPPDDESGDRKRRLKARRSALPAVTHVDYSARVQTVASAENPRFYALLREFQKRTGCPALVNTSFNVRGEPPVCTPEDAFRCFMQTDMDYLVLGEYLLDKSAIAATPARALVSKPASVKKDRESPRTLRRFGFTVGVAFLVLGKLLQFNNRKAGGPFLPVGSLLVLAAAFSPSILRYVHKPWMIMTAFLGRIMTGVILSVVFFLVVTPIGLIQRVAGKRPLEFGFKTNETTYWRRRTRTASAADYERQF
jgi:carbamoyltransferase